MKNRIVRRDAIKLLRSLEDNSVDAVITSPPYNIGVPYNLADDRRSDYTDWSIRWIREAVRVSRNGLVMNIGARASDHNQLFEMIGALTAEGLILQNVIIWVKSVEVGGKTHGHFKPINSKRFVNNTHEYVLHITKRGDSEIDKLAVGVAFTDKSNLKRFGHGQDRRCRGSVWFVPYKTRKGAKKHPATYPLALARMMIRFSGAHKKVVDPFVGSGTTAIAAASLGLGFLGGDMDLKYVKMARRRRDRYMERR